MRLLKTVFFFSFIVLSKYMPAQIFTRITTGDIVNDGGSSFGHSICDFNNDGWEDIFVNNLANNQPNLFYKNNGDGTFTKMPGIEIAEGNASTSSTWGDFDNDGYMDVFVANGGTVSNQKKNFLFSNNGDETFTKILDGDIVNQTAAFTVCSWLDVDNDSDLDLFVGLSSGANRVFINNGNNGFSLNTLNDFGGTWGISWSDYDKDGDLDGFGTNWGISNYFYKNENGSLIKTNMPPLTNGSFNSLSPNWGDFNNDGWMDLFVGNSAGKDRLFQNNGDGSFSEINDSPLTDENINSEGSCWADWDNDGDLDLMVVSGGNQSTGKVRLYENNGSGEFTKIEDGELTSLVARYEGLTCFDYDRDGDLDVFISNYFDNDNLLYQNNGNGNHWLNISLIGTESNNRGIGAKIYVKANINGEEVWQFREIITHSGHIVQGSLNAHFGLGDAEIIDSIMVEWPSQTKQILTNIGVDENIIITEEETTSGTAGILGLKEKIGFKISPNPVSGDAEIEFNLIQAADIKLEILDMEGKLVGSIFNGHQTAGPQKYIWVKNNRGAVLPGGAYMVSLMIGNQMVLENIIVLD